MKKFVALFVSIVMVLSLCAFAAAEDTTVNFWYWADSDDYAATMEEMIADFNATNGQGITVKGERYPWDGGAYSTTLLNAAIGGGGPDVATFKLTATPSFTNNNLLANLDSFIANWADKDDIDENLYNVMKSASGTDSVYVMPWNTQVLYVYYRPSMFAAAGIDHVPTTYDELLEDIAKLTVDTDGDGVTDQYGWGMRGSSGGQEPWGSFIYAAGASFENMNSEEGIKGMQDFIDLYTKGYCPPTAPSDGFAQIKANFLSGLTAMTIHHIGSYKDMVAQFGDDVGAFIFPAGKGRWTSMGDTETVMFDSCANKDAAFAWMAYLATGKGQETWCTVTGNVPVSKRVQAMDAFTSNPFMQVSVEGQPYAGILPILDTTTEWIGNWPTVINMALTGELTAAETMEALQTAMWGE